MSNAVSKSRVLCLMGPTASGKTDLALVLAEHFPVEIINVDSAQIYKGMDIGSGKVCAKIREKIPHHLIDLLEPNIPYSAAKFRTDAHRIIDHIIQRDRIPLLVGGTMLYFKALQQGLTSLPCADPQVRKKLEQKAEQEGYFALYEELCTIDPLSAHRIHPTDRQRIQRALEIYHITGCTLSFLLMQPIPTEDPLFEFVNIALMPVETPRSVLHQLIAHRFDEMLKQGFILEVKALLDRGDMNLALPSLRAVGYRQVAQYLSGEDTYEGMREKAIAATRQLAKRQLTWLRAWQGLHCIDFQELGRVKTAIKIIEQEYKM